ncbi:hypothetical protein [Azospirillum endophyticum]
MGASSKAPGSLDLSPAKAAGLCRRNNDLAPMAGAGSGKLVKTPVAGQPILRMFAKFFCRSFSKCCAMAFQHPST